MTWMRQPSWQGIALFSARMEFWRSTTRSENRHLKIAFKSSILIQPRRRSLLHLLLSREYASHVASAARAALFERVCRRYVGSGVVSQKFATTLRGRRDSNSRPLP